MNSLLNNNLFMLQNVPFSWYMGTSTYSSVSSRYGHKVQLCWSKYCSSLNYRLDECFSVASARRMAFRYVWFGLTFLIRSFAHPRWPAILCNTWSSLQAWATTRPWQGIAGSPHWSPSCETYRAEWAIISQILLKDHVAQCPFNDCSCDKVSTVLWLLA